MTEINVLNKTKKALTRDHIDEFRESIITRLNTMKVRGEANAGKVVKNHSFMLKPGTLSLCDWKIAGVDPHSGDYTIHITKWA